MKKKWTQVLTVLLIVMLVVSGGYILAKNLEYQESAQDYTQAAETANLPRQIEAPPKIPQQTPTPTPEEPDPEPEPDPYFLALGEVDLASLRGTNDEVVGWITIPETDLSYPMLQGTNNSFYLNHTWTGRKNSAGAIFLECKCAKDFSDFNTIIYGHRMHNSTMFGTLREYASEAYWQEHPSVYIVSEQGIYRYDIFAAYEVGIREIVYRLKITETEDKEELIQFALEHSKIQTGVVPQAQEQIITLSTCTGQGHDTRWVVQAVLRDSVEFSV